MTIDEEREWWEMRVKYPFVGDLQEKLDEFQKKLIANGQPPIFIPSAQPNSLCRQLFGFDL